ncbi:MAG: alpha/beta fold hydrolase [Candidatus Thorarchaeota archaeon]
MNTAAQYSTFLLLVIVTVSSFYLSWACEQGLGYLNVERVSLERYPGRTVDFLVYRPISPVHEGPMPIILTIHGLAGSKEGMYSFNTELARRDLVVVSVDLPGHGDSVLPFDIQELGPIAEDCYAALRYVQSSSMMIDNTSYAVLTHSIGAEIAILLSQYPVKPMGYVFVGWAPSVETPPGNMMIAIGVVDEMVSVEVALDVIRRGTGLSSVEPDVTYGSFEDGTAYRVSVAPTEHVFAAVDPIVVSSSIWWLTQCVRGSDESDIVPSSSNMVFQLRTVGMTTGAFALLVSVLPLSTIFRRLGNRSVFSMRLELYVSGDPVRRLIMSAALGVVMTVVFVVNQVLSLYLFYWGLNWPSSMFAPGVMAFFAIFPACGIFVLRRIGVLRLSNGANGESISTTEGSGTARSIIIGTAEGIAIVGSIIILYYVASVVVSPGATVTLYLVRFPNTVRLVNTLLMIPAALVFTVFDCIWVKCLLMSRMRSTGPEVEARDTVLAIASRLLPAAGSAALAVFLITVAGYVTGPLVLVGLLLLTVTVISSLTTLLFVSSPATLRNIFGEALVASFLLCWAIVSSLPLV